MFIISRKMLSVLTASAVAVVSQSAAWAQSAPLTLRKAFASDFLVGVALNTSQVDGRNGKAGEIAAKQFSSVTPENDMKWQSLHPQPDVYQFQSADAYAEFAAKHDMKLIAHNLVWHSQTPDWVFQGENGQPATREQLLKRMHDHILTVAGRYRGKVKGWDVVNEALSDGGPDILRDSPWRRIIGDDFLDYAFRFAREADPKAELYYNDYGLENERKRSNCVKLLRGLIARGVPIDGVGTQSHFGLDHPSLDEVEKTIKDLSGLGLKVMVTELDVDVLPSHGEAGNADISRHEKGDDSLNPYVSGLPDDVQEKLARRYVDLFKIYLRYRKSVTRVTLWGLDDGESWLNGFPIGGRTNYPLLISRDLKPKPAFFALLKLGQDRLAGR
jgi:endo-1,4-beta-xylanase